MKNKTEPTYRIDSLGAGSQVSTPSKVLKATGAEASQIKKVKKQEVAKPLSKAMQQWVEANRSKLKSVTDKQKAIFKKYDQMKKAGMLAAKPAAKKAAAKQPATTSKVTKKVASTTPTKPKSTPAKPKASDKAVKGGYTISPEKRKASTRSAAKQPKPKTTPRRGSGVKKTGKKVNLGKALQNLSDKFKLTRKAGEVFTVGNMRYVSDGKGGIRSSQRIR